MSAQYRPYRDEEDVPPEERAWVDDGPSGRIQIYEKTTHDIHHVVTQRHLVMGGCTIAVVAALFGLCIGYFTHTEHTGCARGRAVALFSIYDEDHIVKSKILSLVNPSAFSSHVDLFSRDSLTDSHIVEITKSEWRKAHLDEIHSDEFTAQVTTHGGKANTLEILDSSGKPIDKIDLQVSPNNFVFVGNSAAKTVTGPLIYGAKLDHKDTQVLSERKIPKNSILLVRYGSLPILQQMQNAESLEAAGIIIYQDTAEYSSTDFNPVAFPRISIPLEGAVDGSEVKLPNLVVQTINSSLAVHLLKELSTSGEAEAPGRMAGKLPVSYTLGLAKKLTVRLSTYNKNYRENFTNVCGLIRGHVEPDRYVIVGAGRDSWSPSNVGGLASLQELGRLFGQLKAEQWKPRRSILLCSFAAEHMASAGLKHFLRKHMNVLRDRAVSYIDVTNPVFGFRSILATGSPILSQALFNASQLVKSANDAATSVYSEWLHSFPLDKTRSIVEQVSKIANSTVEISNSNEEVQYLLETSKIKDNKTVSLFQNYLNPALHLRRPAIRLLDYTDGFGSVLTQVGIPVVQMSYVNIDYFENTRMDPKPFWFRTQFDSLKKVHPHEDNQYMHQMAATKVVAELVRDLVDSLYIPFNLIEYAVTLKTYSDAAEKHFTTLFPEAKGAFSSLTESVNKFMKLAVSFHERQSRLDVRDPMAIRMVNDQLLLVERSFLYNHAPTNSIRHVIAEAPRAYPQLGSIFPSVLDLIMTSLGSKNLNEPGSEIRDIVSDLSKAVNDAADFIREVNAF